MKVNDIDLADFKARLIKKDIQTAEVVIYDDWLRQSDFPLFLGKKEKYKQIKIQLIVRDSDDELCLNHISNLVKQFEKCIIKFYNLSFYYDCVIVVKNHERKSEKFYVLDVELKGFAYKAELTETLNHIATKTINIPGNLPTPAIVKITPAIDMVSLALTGLTKKPIKINNIIANVPIIIDGEKCLVTESDIDTVITSETGANKWNLRKYSMANMISPEDWDIPFAPKYTDIPIITSYAQQLVSEGASLARNLGYTYLGHLKTAVNVTTAKTISFNFTHDDGATIYLNGVAVYSHTHTSWENTGGGVATMNLVAGWNVIEILWINLYGPDGVWDISPTIGSQVTAVNCFYAKSTGLGIVNKFGDTDMWSFPVLQPGVNTIGVSNANCTVDIKYKPKYI